MSERLSMAAAPSRSGLAIAPFDSAFLADSKFRMLARQLRRPMDFAAAVGVWSMTLAETWRTGSPEGIDAASMSDLPADGVIISALIRVGLLDSAGCIPEGPWIQWSGAVRDRRAKDAARKRKARAQSEGVTPDSGGVLRQDEVSRDYYLTSPHLTTTDKDDERNEETGIARDGWRLDPSEREALVVACPECGADAGQPCRGVRPDRTGEPWQRWSVHRPRWEATAAGSVRREPALPEHWPAVAALAEELTGRAYALPNPLGGLGALAVAQVQRFGLVRVEQVWRQVAAVTADPPIDAGQLVLGAGHVLAPIPRSPTAASEGASEADLERLRATAAVKNQRYQIIGEEAAP